MAETHLVAAAGEFDSRKLLFIVFLKCALMGAKIPYIGSQSFHIWFEVSWKLETADRRDRTFNDIGEL